MATGTIILPVQGAKVTGAFITAGAGIEGGAGAWKLLFDASITESALFQFRMPANYSSGLTGKLLYAMASDDDSDHKVDMEIEIMAVTGGESADDDIDTASFDSVNEVSGGTAIPGGSGGGGGEHGDIDEISITCTNADSVAAGDLVLARVNRDHDDADDTATGDLELLAFSFEYTTT